MSVRLRRTLAEAIGTYFLVLIGPGAAMVDAWSGGAVTHVGVALSFAFVVLAVIYAIGHLSGAHINPAVTVGFWVAGRFPGRDAGLYIVAQCSGAVLASLTLLWCLGPVGELGATIPAIPTAPAFLIEALLSFILMFVIMAVATDARVAGEFAGVAVGLTVGFDALMGGPLTGASMNPARSLGPALVGGVWDAHWLYWAAPITGMVVAARTYDFLRPATAPSAIPRGIPLGVEGPIDRTTMSERRIELVYFDGCPHADEARANLRTVAGPNAWCEWNLSSETTPASFRRYGSPTVLVDGRDVMGEGGRSTGVACRAGGAPPADVIRTALG